MHPADRLEQPQVRAAQPLLLGDADQHRRARVAGLCTGCPSPGTNRLAARVAVTASSASASQPASSVGSSPSVPLEDLVQVGAAVLGHAEEPRAAAEEARRRARPAASPGAER